MPPTKQQHTITRIGDCTLVLGSCLTYIEQMPPMSIALTLTDPPYGIAYETIYRYVSETPDMIHGDASLDVVAVLLPKIPSLLAGGGGLYMFASPKNIDDVLPLVRKRFKVKNLLAWDKGNWTAGDLYGAYGYQYESIIYATLSDEAGLLAKRCGDVLHFARVTQPSQIHPNQKPLDLLRFLIENTTKPGDLVFDPCMGSGSTGAACVQTGRKFIGCEIDSTYYHSAVAYVQHATQMMVGAHAVAPGSLGATQVDVGNGL